MRSLNALLMLMGALSVLLLGAVPASATAGDGGAMAPCHEQVAKSHGGHQQAPATETPDTAMAAMACCISCVVATAPRPPTRGPIILAEPPAAPAPASLPVGLSLAPEHGPPKT